MRVGLLDPSNLGQRPKVIRRHLAHALANLPGFLAHGQEEAGMVLLQLLQRLIAPVQTRPQIRG